MNKAGIILKNERGDITGTSVLIIMAVIIILSFALVDIFGYLRTHDKLSSATDDTLDLAQAQNGFDAQLRNQFYDLAEKFGLERSKIQVQGTPGPVQRGEIIEIRAHTTYTCVAFTSSWA